MKWDLVHKRYATIKLLAFEVQPNSKALSVHIALHQAKSRRRVTIAEPLQPIKADPKNQQSEGRRWGTWGRCNIQASSIAYLGWFQRVSQ